ncbi:MAG: serine/threonine protein kinase [Anaerolineae bacterium]|nr:serine/threonine protein kinase [Anaerolineae bacterium]
MNDLIGKQFGPYQVTSLLGEGGMAVVYKGYQQSLNRHVAIKVLRQELAANQDFIERFRREALAVADLSHPNILHVYDAGSRDGVHFIVMAYVDGGSLKDLIMQGPVEPDLAVSIVAQVAEALDHAHQRGLVHRDVKPSNILMSRDGRPLLTDFGIAKAVHETTGLTRTGTSIGTPEYMAPEQIQGQKVDGRTDIYALGIVLYEMLVGWVPFSSTTPVATLYKQVNDPPPPLRQANVSVPDWLDKVVAKALAKTPNARFQSGAEMAAALRQQRAPSQAPTAVSGGTPRPRAVPPAEARRERSKMVPLLIGAIAVLFLALIVVVVLFAMDGFGGGEVTPITITEVVPFGSDGSFLTPEPLEAFSGHQGDGWLVEDLDPVDLRLLYDDAGL